MTKKTYALIGMIVSLAIVLCGILTISGTLGGDAHYASGASYLYDSGYASFGADFYTYVSNNAAEAADAASTVASNVRSVAELQKNVFGIFLMGFGLMGFCFFGMASAECKAAAAPAPVPADAPEQEETPEQEESPAEI